MAMSSMPKHQFLYPLILMVGVMGTLQAQPSRWAQWYQNHQLDSLFAALQHSRIYQPQWRMFVQALQTTRGDSAVRLMAQAYAHTQDPTLRSFIQQRIYQYYYAGGYYRTAEKIKTQGDYILKLIPAQESGNKMFGIQIGAFRSRENALKLKQSWQDKLYDIRIVEVQRGSKQFYIVVVGKFTSRDAALKYREMLNQKWQLRGYIFQY